MATNNAINTTFPFGTGAGGTGKSSFTYGSLLVGDGSNAIKEVPIGAEGQLLAYSNSSGPYWTSSIDADFGLTGSNSNARFLLLLIVMATATLYFYYRWVDQDRETLLYDIVLVLVLIAGIKG